MRAFILSAQQTGLDDWGIPEDVGAVTLEGEVRIAGRFDLGEPAGAVFGGVYAATRGKYRVVYPFHEHATLLSGNVELTDEATGLTVSYGPGDSWIIAKGTSVIWSIVSERICKSYLATTAHA
ncbi:cupin domain-containing protein [Mesorhizobium sp. ORS 3428]|uniref:cupin domain-containing protein n=1 Tax=Mesorhizobium sp. ORS 3428 TaxID=540997 RepID=UPI0008D95CA7|nr:cupin domain-containing protein [Mesorhizobium sp. ORS 3428]OHV87637.1 hypothetical protein ORS3428_20280 [Mesorhizobium sp. ORS 3428]